MVFPQGVMVLQVGDRVPRLPCHFAVSISRLIFVQDSPWSSCKEAVREVNSRHRKTL